ncbi:hypothetical protein TNCV_1107531 [Trichonephila clavipes]|nr:hypothetical protein TNCV_1107531 [Trichonephila clavipes]
MRCQSDSNHDDTPPDDFTDVDTDYLKAAISASAKRREMMEGTTRGMEDAVIIENDTIGAVRACQIVIRSCLAF